MQTDSQGIDWDNITDPDDIPFTDEAWEHARQALYPPRDRQARAAIVCLIAAFERLRDMVQLSSPSAYVAGGEQADWNQAFDDFQTAVHAAGMALRAGAEVSA